jgi:hypothetical protein
MATSRPASLGHIVVELHVLKVETAEIEISMLQEVFISVGDRSGTGGKGEGGTYDNSCRDITIYSVEEVSTS